jgi:MFS family permease
VAWNRRGTTTGLVQFSRSIGGSVGLGLMGGILTAAVGTHSAAVLDPFTRDNISPAELAATRLAIAGGLSMIFWIVFVAGVAAFLVAWRTMPSLHIRELRQGRPPEETERELVEDAVESGLALEGGVEFVS